MTPFTKRQREVLEFLKEYFCVNQAHATSAEIANHFGFKSPNGAFVHLLALECQGCITIIPNTARGIVINGYTAFLLKDEA